MKMVEIVTKCADNVEYADFGNRNREYIVNKTDIERLVEVDHRCRSTEDSLTKILE